jgi:hypothetical protein
MEFFRGRWDPVWGHLVDVPVWSELVLAPLADAGCAVADRRPGVPTWQSKCKSSTDVIKGASSRDFFAPPRYHVIPVKKKTCGNRNKTRLTVFPRNFSVLARDNSPSCSRIDRRLSLLEL